mmetsp:Transcript_58278/g.138848  ORF Transcript_58278/g.138848 Transcript_58278/m.138848 type:complete len:257 (-) Transcript_58278:563-1333(-)
MPWRPSIQPNDLAACRTTELQQQRPPTMPGPVAMNASKELLRRHAWPTWMCFLADHVQDVSRKNAGSPSEALVTAVLKHNHRLMSVEACSQVLLIRLRGGIAKCHQIPLEFLIRAVLDDLPDIVVRIVIQFQDLPNKVSITRHGSMVKSSKAINIRQPQQIRCPHGHSFHVAVVSSTTEGEELLKFHLVSLHLWYPETRSRPRVPGSNPGCIPKRADCNWLVTNVGHSNRSTNGGCSLLLGMQRCAECNHWNDFPC